LILQKMSVKFSYSTLAEVLNIQAIFLSAIRCLRNLVLTLLPFFEKMTRFTLLSTCTHTVINIGKSYSTSFLANSSRTFPPHIPDHPCTPLFHSRNSPTQIPTPPHIPDHPCTPLFHLRNSGQFLLYLGSGYQSTPSASLVPALKSVQPSGYLGLAAQLGRSTHTHWSAARGAANSSMVLPALGLL
jgi:hypothetical protein